MPGQQQELNKEEIYVLEATFERLEGAKRAVEQAKRDLGTVMRAVGLSAAARHLDRTRQWALQLAQDAEKSDAHEAENKESGQLPGATVEELTESIRRLGVVEPILVEPVGGRFEFLKVVDGHRRLRAASDAGVRSLPVSLLLGGTATPAQPPTGRPRGASGAPDGPGHPNVAAAEAAARAHRRVNFFYSGLEGDPRVRTVDAWGLVWRSGLAYLVGYDQDRGAIRTFRIDRVLDEIRDIGEGSAAPEGFSAERNVWSQLDPEVMDAMQATFLRVFREVNEQRLEVDEAVRERLRELSPD